MELDDILDEFESFATQRQKKYGTLLAFSLTNLCPLKCEHCIVDANTAIKEMSAEEFHRCLLQLKDIDIKQLKQFSITGGEPFFVPEKLKVFSDFCHEKNIALGVVTSAYWATSYNNAIELVRKYKGVSHYSISTDKYHLRYVDLSNIKHAYLAAKQLGKKAVIRITGESSSSAKEDDNFKDIYSFIEDEQEVVFQRLLPFGRAKYNCKEKFTFTKTRPLLPCFSNAPVVRENGFVEPCCGAIISLQGKHPMVLGNVLEENLSTILKKAKYNWIFNYIRLWGLGDLIDAVQDSSIKNRLSCMYLDGDDVCTACCELFADEDVSNFLKRLSGTLSFRLKVAIGLYHYFNDDSAINIIKEQYHL